MEDEYRKFLDGLSDFDAAHGMAHIERVVSNAKRLLKSENADREIVIAAAWLHDCVSLPKDHPDKKRSSTLAAEKAGQFLKSIQFDEKKIEKVRHAIEAHSFSSGITPCTIEAKIVQDADRLDALGAVGIARCFMIGGLLNRPIYNPKDPFCDNSEPDDQLWTIDHFYTKLFKLKELLNTDSAKKEAEKRVEFMHQYLQRLREEI